MVQNIVCEQDLAWGGGGVEKRSRSFFPFPPTRVCSQAIQLVTKPANLLVSENLP